MDGGGGAEPKCFSEAKMKKQSRMVWASVVASSRARLDFPEATQCTAPEEAAMGSELGVGAPG